MSATAPLFRVLIDTSVLIRALLYSMNPARAVDVLLDAAFDGVYILLLPELIVVELIDKVTVDRYLSERITVQRARAFLAELSDIGLPLPPLDAPAPRRIRDPKDDYLLAYALRDGADFLVTGDRDLRDLAPSFPKPRILDPGAFVQELRAAGLL